MKPKQSRSDVGNWQSKSVDGWWAKICVAGNYQVSEMLCRKVCFPKGLCVTIEKTKYIYAGGAEDGVCVGLIQYPKFPETVADLMKKAILLGKQLAEENHQWSFTIITATENIWFSRRNAD